MVAIVKGPPRPVRTVEVGRYPFSRCYVHHAADMWLRRRFPVKRHNLYFRRDIAPVE